MIDGEGDGGQKLIKSALRNLRLAPNPVLFGLSYYFYSTKFDHVLIIVSMQINSSLSSKLFSFSDQIPKNLTIQKWVLLRVLVVKIIYSCKKINLLEHIFTKKVFN